MNSFSKDLLDVIDMTYDEFSPEHFRKDAFRIFDDGFYISVYRSYFNESRGRIPSLIGGRY